jgi:transposase
MFKADQTSQRQLFAFSVRELIPEASDLWLYVDLFDELDLCAFDQDYSSQGEEGHEPRLVLRTIFYGLTHGVVTGRKLAEACSHDSRYMVLSGQNHPSYRTFARFVIRHQARMEELFVQVVRLAQKMGLASLGRIAIDGSRFKAKTSKHKAMSYGRMTEAINTIKEELAKLKDDLTKANAAEDNASTLPNEISRREKRLAKIQSAKAALEREAREAGKKAVDPKAQKSFHDLEAQPSARANGSFMYSYNCQAAVDADNQIIVAAEVHDSTSDATALSEVLDAVESNCERSAEAVLADSAYNSYSNLEAASAKGSKAYFAMGKGEDEATKDAIDSLKYYGKLDQFRCQGGRPLKSVCKRSTGTRGLMMPKASCRGCPLKRECQVYNRVAKTFWIPDAERFILAREHRRRMASPNGKAVYARRKVIVEPVFGNLKNKGIRILRKGRGKASTWWKIACTAHNIEKIIKNR